jgi:hypothetical protein
MDVNGKMRFILTGFTQELGFRVFAFERVDVDRIRTEFTVKADLSLIRRYDIRMQELPLLCRSLLERQDTTAEMRAVTFTEQDMLVHSKDSADARRAAAEKRRPPRKPATENLGAAWRGPRPL